VFIGMGLAMYNKDKGQRNISKDIINMIILNDSISSLYEIESKTNGYKTLNMEVLKNSLIIPQEKIVNNKYINSFDGEIVVKPYTQKQSNDSFLIETSNIPKEACMKMSMSFPSYIPVLIVNDHVVKENLESQIDRSSLLTACDHDSNKIGIINKY
jgi:hypothetical protein